MPPISTSACDIRSWGRCGRDFGHIDDLSEGCPSRQLPQPAVGRGQNAVRPNHVGKPCRPAVAGDGPKTLAIVAQKGAIIGTAESMRPLQNRVEHWREIAGR